ncbi:MAG: hypothetical protein ACQKBW_08960 [Puniceicoccales bacterium]
MQSNEASTLDEAFVFYLGVFESGFSPTGENVDAWAEHWTTVDAVNYNPDYQIFNARHTTTDSDPVPGTRGYIWGIRRDANLQEWVLISDPAWTWPSNELLGMKVSWMVADASEAIIGVINNGTHHIVTENVGNAPLPKVDYAIWAKRFFADGDANADVNADPDSNGRVNALDFALDDNPAQTGSNKTIESGIFEVVQDAEAPNGERYLAVIITPSIDANVTFSGTVADDPTFTQNPTPAVVEELADGRLMIRDSEPSNNLAQAKFLKVNVE